MGERRELHAMKKLLLENKVIIVSGATRGLGLVMARAFVKHGAFVVVTGSRKSAALEAVSLEFGDRAICLEANAIDPNSALKVVDKAMQNRDYTLLRNFLSDTVSITASNGVKYDLESFISRRLEIDSIVDSRNASLKWEFSNIYSVDLDPTRGGEHVSVTYSGEYEDENGKDTWNSINRYYVMDGKVVWWNTFNQDIIDSEN